MGHGGRSRQGGSGKPQAERRGDPAERQGASSTDRRKAGADVKQATWVRGSQAAGARSSHDKLSRATYALPRSAAA